MKIDARSASVGAISSEAREPKTMNETFEVETVVRLQAAPALLSLLAMLLLPGLAQGAAIYVVDREPLSEFQPLPIDPDVEVVEHINYVPGADGPVPSGSGGSSGIVLPFPILFFDIPYDELAVGAGIITFGPRSDTFCASNVPAPRPNCASSTTSDTVGPIPRDGYPNLLLAVWWARDWTGTRIGCTTKSQVLGEAPERAFVMELACSGSYTAQVWLREGSATIEVRYAESAPGEPIRDIFSQVGLMSPVEGGGVEGYAGLGCSRMGLSCDWYDYPSLSKLTYSVPADLSVEEVLVDGRGTPGLPLDVRVDLRNIGEDEVEDTNVHFYLSRSSTLDASAISLGELPGGFALTGRSSRELSWSVDLPSDLEAGPYHIIARVDPHGAASRDPDLANNVRASEVVVVDAPHPTLSILSVEAAAAGSPGGTLPVSWSVENSGSADATRIGVEIYLSESEEFGPWDRRLFVGEFSAPAFDQYSETIPLLLPPDLEAGIYHLGVLLDPQELLPPALKPLPIGRSGRIRIGGSILRILNDALPVAELGSDYCVRLDAAGGGMEHRWSVAKGTSLPPGLALRELPLGAREAGEPFVTMLCGRPSAVGTFHFGLEVRSDEEAAAGTFELIVQEPRLPLELITTELEQAGFLTPFEARLRASGGTAPYRWNLRSGALPQGLLLLPQGIITGFAKEDGSFPFTLEVADAGGRSVTASLTLFVSSPERLSCGTIALPAGALGEDYAASLLAAGGAKPYRWTSRELRRLSDEPGDPSVALGAEPPKGLSLSQQGEITGVPAQAGRYLWTLELRDEGKIPAQIDCVVRLDINAHSSLHISTVALYPAVAGMRYEARLQASNASGATQWSLLGGNRLPAGLSLSPSGRIEGTPELAQLEHRSERDFSFIVEARDAANRRGIATLSIQVHAAAPGSVIGAPARKEPSGCSAGGQGPGLLHLLSIGALAIVARRAKRRFIPDQGEGQPGPAPRSQS